MMTIRALVEWDTFAWVAQGIEHDVCGQGATPADAASRMIAAADMDREFARAEGREWPLDTVPDEVGKAWEESTSEPSTVTSLGGLTFALKVLPREADA